MSTTINVSAPSSQSGADYRSIKTSSLKTWDLYSDAPPLTTIYTYRPSCIGRWLVTNDNSASKTVYSVYPQGGPIDDKEWTNCQPFGNYATYSPAVCPDHQELAGITELRFVTSGMSLRRWDGACCPSGLRLVDEILGPICSGTFTTPFQAFAPITGANSATIVTSGITSINTTTWTSYFPGQNAGNTTTISKPGELDSRSVRVVGGPPQELDETSNVNRES